MMKIHIADALKDVTEARILEERYLWGPNRKELPLHDGYWYEKYDPRRGTNDRCAEFWNNNDEENDPQYL